MRENPWCLAQTECLVRAKLALSSILADLGWFCLAELGIVARKELNNCNFILFIFHLAAGNLVATTSLVSKAWMLILECRGFSTTRRDLASSSKTMEVQTSSFIVAWQLLKQKVERQFLPTSGCKASQGLTNKHLAEAMMSSTNCWKKVTVSSRLVQIVEIAFIWGSKAQPVSWTWCFTAAEGQKSRWHKWHMHIFAYRGRGLNPGISCWSTSSLLMFSISFRHRLVTFVKALF